MRDVWARATPRDAVMVRCVTVAAPAGLTVSHKGTGALQVHNGQVYTGVWP